MRPVLMIITGSISVVVSIVMFVVALAQLTTNITLTGLTYNLAMPGLYSVQGVFGIVIFIVFVGAGLAMIGVGSYRAVKEGRTSGGSSGGKSRR
jgi:hypothetical protein